MKQSYIENQTLCFRVLAYYYNTVPGGSTIITSGFLTLVDARQLLAECAGVTFVKAPKLQIYMQGDGWSDFSE